MLFNVWNSGLLDKVHRTVRSKPKWQGKGERYAIKRNTKPRTKSRVSTPPSEGIHNLGVYCFNLLLHSVLCTINLNSQFTLQWNYSHWRIIIYWYGNSLCSIPFITAIGNFTLLKMFTKLLFLLCLIAIVISSN